MVLSMVGLSQMDNFENKSVMFDNFNEVKQFELLKSNQLTTYSYKYNNNVSNNMLGPGMMLGGTAFLVAGILTGTNRVEGTNQNAFYDLNRYLAIGTGVVLLPTGIIVTIATR